MDVGVKQTSSAVLNPFIVSACISTWRKKGIKKRIIITNQYVNVTKIN